MLELLAADVGSRGHPRLVLEHLIERALAQPGELGELLDADVLLDARLDVALEALEQARLAAGLRGRLVMLQGEQQLVGHGMGVVHEQLRA